MVGTCSSIHQRLTASTLPNPSVFCASICPNPLLPSEGLSPTPLLPYERQRVAHMLSPALSPSEGRRDWDIHKCLEMELTTIHHPQENTARFSRIFGWSQ